jgi:hypothetical protein
MCQVTNTHIFRSYGSEHHPISNLSDLLYTQVSSIGKCYYEYQFCGSVEYKIIPLVLCVNYVLLHSGQLHLC